MEEHHSQEGERQHNGCAQAKLCLGTHSFFGYVGSHLDDVMQVSHFGNVTECCIAPKGQGSEGGVNMLQGPNAYSYLKCDSYALRESDTVAEL